MTNYDCLIVIVAVTIEDDTTLMKKAISAGTAVVRTVFIPVIVTVNAKKKHKWNC